MQTKGPLHSLRFTNENEAWIDVKVKACGEKRRGVLAEIVNLAVTEMRQGQEFKRPRRSRRK